MGGGGGLGARDFFRGGGMEMGSNYDLFYPMRSDIVSSRGRGVGVEF